MSRAGSSGSRGRPGRAPTYGVIQPGTVRAGDPVEIVHRPAHAVTVALSLHALTLEPALLPLLTAATALPQEERDAIHRRTAGS